MNTESSRFYINWKFQKVCLKKTILLPLTNFMSQMSFYLILVKYQIKRIKVVQKRKGEKATLCTVQYLYLRSVACIALSLTRILKSALSKPTVVRVHHLADSGFF